jgi:putative addiction module component (TIGR02574 family)
LSPPRPSIFDLTPPEKLQLVEDLWDDLASTPETVPVHDWQKQELARRKANLLKNPGSGLGWEEVNAEPAKGMAVNLAREGRFRSGWRHQSPQPARAGRSLPRQRSESRSAATSTRKDRASGAGVSASNRIFKRLPQVAQRTALAKASTS